jgi:hypothetical protein
VPSCLTTEWKTRRGNAGEEGDAARLSVVADEAARGQLREDLDGLARESARRMVVRNGHARQRQVLTAAGGDAGAVGAAGGGPPDRSGER